MSTRGRGTTSSTAGSTAGSTARTRWEEVLAGLTAVVVTAAVAVRLALLGRQSYWSDEIFSVDQASRGFARMARISLGEIHTPLYATLLWVWEHLVGTHTAQTRAFSAALGLATIAAAWFCLRGVVSERARLLAVALTAASGFGIVYAQDDRPYALALLGCTGLTALTPARRRQLRDGSGRWRDALPWAAWGLLAATAHLLGAVLVGVFTVALAVIALRAGARRAALAQLAAGGAALLPQLAWIAAGELRSGFAGGTTWIAAPRPGDVRTLLTTIFSSGGLTPQADGFAWTSPAGLGVAAVLLLAGGVLALAGRRVGGAPGSDAGGAAGWGAAGAAGPAGGGASGDAAARSDLRDGLLLLGLAAATLAVTYGASQVVHVWTLRNLIVVLPAVTWGTAWVTVSLPGTQLERGSLAAAVLVALLVSLGVVARDLGRPYRTDWRSLVLYLAQVRTQDPAAEISVFGGRFRGVFLAADRDPDDPGFERIDDRLDLHRRSTTAIRELRRLPGRQVVVFYTSVAHPVDAAIRQRILRRLADPTCTPVPIYGVVVVSCG